MIEFKHTSKEGVISITTDKVLAADLVKEFSEFLLYLGIPGEEISKAMSHEAGVLCLDDMYEYYTKERQ